jgi:hypothetical protein
LIHIATFVPEASLQRLAATLAGVLSVVACSALGANAQANSGTVPGMYATKAEAEAAAKTHFNCTGAHQMGNQWMPCRTHGQTSGNAQHNH